MKQSRNLTLCIITAVLLCSFLMFSGCTGEENDLLSEGGGKSVSTAGGEWTLLSKDRCCEFEQSNTYLSNFGKSDLLFQDVIKYFANDDFTEYTDDFGGVYFDNKGILNICVVGNLTPIESDYLIYHRVNNSWNFMLSVVKEIGDFFSFEDFSVWMIWPCPICNKVSTCLEDESNIPTIVEHLKGKNMFKMELLNFFVGKNNIEIATMATDTAE